MKEVNSGSNSYAEGFALTFKGVGNDANYSDWRTIQSYKVVDHLVSSTVGTFRYPEDGSEGAFYSHMHCDQQSKEG